MPNSVHVPPIKCQGIKTKLVPWIIKNAPTIKSGRYIEPFLGSGVVAFNLLPERALLADSNPPLIRFYKSLQAGLITSKKAALFLKTEGEKLSKEANYFYEVRSRFNKHQDPLDFLFLSRSCFNGLIRFNRKGQYNVPFGHKPQRFSKSYITKIIHQVEYAEYYLTRRNWELRCSDFRTTLTEAKKGDFVYCDPPYIGRHVDYYDSWSEQDEKNLHEALQASEAQFMVSTWHSNKFRKNSYIETLWSQHTVLKKLHFYHVGAAESNRNAMTEALILNYPSLTDINLEIEEARETPQLAGLFG